MSYLTYTELREREGMVLALNFLGYYAVWWSIIYFQNKEDLKYILLIFLINLSFHFLFFVKNRTLELKMVLVTLFLGLIVDTLLISGDIFSLKRSFYFWLPIIWCSFAMTINHSIEKFFLQKSNVLLFALGAILGPLSYYAAGIFGLVIYPNSAIKIIFHAMSFGALLVSLKFIKGKLYEIS